MMADTEDKNMEGLGTEPDATPAVGLTQPGTVADFSQLSSEETELMNNLNMDPYDEDQAEIRFLHSKPTCFIVLGKPGAGKTTISQKLAQEWKCQHVNGQEVLNQAIDMQTEIGVKCQEMLMRGEAVPDEIIAKMVEDKINSQEVAHHGYVLDGFPYFVEDIMSIKDQLELVKNWKLKPDFIINLKIPDKDLETRRVNQRVDSLTGELYTKDVYDPDKSKPAELSEEGEEEEEESEEEIEEEEAVVGLAPEVMERLRKRPEDLQHHVQENITKYKTNMLRILEDYMADHDQQYLIELDANKPVNVIFKELLTRLECFVLHSAAVPVKLLDADAEEISHDVDTDELMRQLAPKQMVAPRYRWRRSRWLKQCPVALAEGNIMQGKAEFAVSFLDKMYCMSSEEAMAKFMKNPRPYLLPPQPRPPCKLIVTGPPLSGKTTLCHLLAQKYNAKVLNMDEFIKPRLDEERKRIVDQVREETTESAIITIRNKMKEQWELEQQHKQAALALERERALEAEALALERESALEAEESSVTGEATEDASETKSEKADQETSENIVKHETTTDTTKTGTEAADRPTFDVDAEHPEVKTIVEMAVEAAMTQEVTLQPEVWMEAMEEVIKQTEEEMRQKNPAGPLHGGWIFDNFPRTRDQWTAMFEKGISADEVICLRDESEHGNFLIKRWFKLNRKEVEAKAQIRQEAEEAKKRMKEEEERLHLLEEKKAAEKAAKIVKEQERQRRIDSGEEVTDDEGEEKGEEDTIPAVEMLYATEFYAFDETHTESPRTEEPEQEVDKDLLKPERITPEPSSSDADTKTESDESPSTSDLMRSEEEKMPPEGPEVDAQREVRKQWDTEWNYSVSIISGSSSLDPINIEIFDSPEEGPVITKTEEKLLKDTALRLEKSLMYQGWELQGNDIDEEEEDAEAERVEEEEEEAAEEEEDPNRSSKKQLGDVNYFCPVALVNQNVLWPGSPETAAKYRDKLYYFSNTEARDKFLEDPTAFLPKGEPFKPPTIRLLILGPKGSGKSLHGRQLAQKLGLFHIQYRERLQELIIAKTKKKIGPEYEEEPEEPEEPEEEDEEEENVTQEGAITNPDGSSYLADESVSDKKDDTTIQDEKTEVVEEEEEKEVVDLTEDEEAIIAYLKEDEPLSAEVLDKIIPDWWNKEPFKSTGFILEGFPRTTDETEYLAEKGLFPDAALILAVEDTDIFGRLLPPKMDKWRQKRDKKLARKQKIKEKKEKKKAAAIEKRRMELLKEQEEKRAQRKIREVLKAERQAEREDAGNGSDSETELEEEEEEEEEDIEAILLEEFEQEEEEEEEEEELEEDASDRMQNDLAEVYDNDTNKLSEVQNKLEEFLVPRIELDAGRKAHIVQYTIKKRLKNIIQYRRSLFERIYPISERLAIKMLKTGYKQPSRFGRWCPYQLLEGEVIQPMQGPNYQTYPAIYRSFIYFLSSEIAREQFMQDPMTYLTQRSPMPVVPIRIAITGPPKSGKTTLARRFVDVYGLVRLSVGEAMRSLLEQQPKSELAMDIKRHLVKGLTVPDELAVQALEVAIMDMRCQTRGYILDGYPVTKKQVDLMTQHNIIPVRVIELQINAMEVATRATKDRFSEERIHPIHDSAQITAIKLGAYQRETPAVQEWYIAQHANHVEFNAQCSKWCIWSKVLDLAKKSVMQIQAYLQRIADGKAASIADMCITPTEFVVRLGDYGQYCPIRLAAGELVDCATTTSLKYAAEFRGHYYKMAGQKELDEFLSNPEKYTPPLAEHKLPKAELRPIRRNAAYMKEHFPSKVELQGYCPITFKDGKQRYEAIIPGDPDLIVEYRGKYYSMETEEKLLKFMRLPEDYWKLELPHKLPPKKSPLPVTGLPMLGYMEQAISAAVVKSLTAVGNFKPKFPHLSPSKSALIYVAYHLKAYNPKSSEYLRKKYKRKLMDFENTCELISYLGDNMTKKYKKPNERPIDFDSKLEKFVQLRDVEPSSSWLK